MTTVGAFLTVGPTVFFPRHAAACSARSSALNQKAVAETREYSKPYSFVETVNDRDEILIKLIQMKAAAGQIP